VVVTALPSKINSGAFRKFIPRTLLSLPFWEMDLWWHGAIPTVVVTAVQFKISYGPLKRFIAALHNGSFGCDLGKRKCGDMAPL
jgi:hypothetical protein